MSEGCDQTNGKTSTAPRSDAWVTVTGEYAGTSPAEPTIPVLRANTIAPINAPENPYD